MKPTADERELVDIAWELVYTAWENHKTFKNIEQLAKWFQEKYTILGFEVGSCGSTYSLLKDKNDKR